MSTERYLFPFGVYDTNLCMMLWIGLHENETACWRVYLGWPTRGEVKEAKAKGLCVIPLTITYDPPR